VVGGSFENLGGGGVGVVDLMVVEDLGLGGNELDGGSSLVFRANMAAGGHLNDF